jgi:hypothetical protein
VRHNGYVSGRGGLRCVRCSAAATYTLTNDDTIVGLYCEPHWRDAYADYCVFLKQATKGMLDLQLAWRRHEQESYDRWCNERFPMTAEQRAQLNEFFARDDNPSHGRETAETGAEAE